MEKVIQTGSYTKGNTQSYTISRIKQKYLCNFGLSKEVLDMTLKEQFI